VVENIIEYPLSIASTSVDFTHAYEKNIKIMVQEIEEYKERIMSLEEEVKFTKEIGPTSRS
jgi:hypothetical protein